MFERRPGLGSHRHSHVDDSDYTAYRYIHYSVLCNGCWLRSVYAHMVSAALCLYVHVHHWQCMAYKHLEHIVNNANANKKRAALSDGQVSNVRMNRT
jgi:hypothetical protein